ncbi:hypothetical protein Ddye_030245, partial [Dipteronia dyeriana]
VNYAANTPRQNNLDENAKGTSSFWMFTSFGLVSLNVGLLFDCEVCELRDNLMVEL